MGVDDRINGWKAIGAHFGRDRSTAIRWAQDRGLPVRSVPGGGAKRTVYALKSELDAWQASQGEAAPDPAPAEPPVEAPAPRVKRWPIVATLALIAIALAAAWALWPRAPSDPMPKDAQIAALYLQGRDHAAQRDAPALKRAVGELEAVTRADPGFAPAWSALAEASLLAREFGSLPDNIAYERARRSAERALALDPNLAAAHRAIGFVAYWWEHDRARAAKAFHTALRLAPDDGQTHFWYGNVLADNGEDAAARRELDAARLAMPGSLAIDTDYAWALWSAGETKAVYDRLSAIVARAPNFAVAHDCLADMRLAEGDYDGYLNALTARQAARAEPGLGAKIAVYRQAQAAGGTPALQRAMLDRALADEAGSPFPDHAFAALLASVAGDRVALMNVLALADHGRETWGSAGYVRRIAARWKGDAQIIDSLARRRPPRIDR
jgi:tetratricopeptide (TPR) repeat protein